MAKIFTALNVEQYCYLISNKRIPLIDLENNKKGFSFTEDKSYWIEKLKNQEDKENLADYKYSILIEMDINAEDLNLIFHEFGRFSHKIAEYYNQIEKTLTKQILSEQETDVLCIEDVYESTETKDGISQQWSIITESEFSKIWLHFSDKTYKIACIGAIPGAVELAKSLIS